MRDVKINIDRKNQILDAALEVFVKKGYSQTRMNDIADVSGLSKGAIYHHYSSKRDLFLKLIDFWEVYCFPNILDKKYENKTAPGILREIVKDIINTNFIGTILFSRESAKLMKRNQFGRIVNIVSVDTPLKLEGTAIYAASKAAVVNFTEIIAKELSAYNITINSVGPAPIKTDLIQGISEKKFTSMLDKQAIKRYSEFNDISNVIDFFVQRQSDFVTGQVIYLGGV